ncbi:MAG: SPOR domain-containing protein [Mariprofundales bacterium]
MSDDKEPADNHDFSDFDDLFAEQDDDFDPNAVLDAVSDDAPSTSDAKPIEDEDIDALINDLMDDDSLDDSGSDDLAPDSTADENDPSVAAGDELLDQEWDDVVTPDEEPVAAVADENEESLPSDPPEVDSPEAAPPEVAPPEAAPSEVGSELENEAEAVDAMAEPDAVDDDLVMDDDETPDIDFVDDAAAKEAVDGVTDDAVEELENFDDFIVDDDEPAIAPEFGEQAELDPIPKPIEPEISPPVADSPPAVDRADEWVDNEIVPDRSSDSDRSTEPDENDEEEDEAVKQSNMIALIAGAVALVASMGGLWLGYSAKVELAQRPVLAAGGSALDAAKLQAIDDKVGQMDERITKLSTRLASFGAMSGGSSDPKVDALDSRTARLEQLVSDVKEEIGHLRHTISAQPAKAASASKAVKKVHKKRVKAKPRRQHKAVVVAPRGGKWFVNLTSHSNRKSAQHQVQRMANRGIAAESRQVVVKGRTYYRVRVAGFASRSKAIAFKAMLAKKYNVSDSWVSNH